MPGYFQAECAWTLRAGASRAFFVSSSEHASRRFVQVAVEHVKVRQFWSRLHLRFARVARAQGEPAKQ